ncbi:MAG TPA: aminoacyl-histidine dipeptidase [Candidatus Krumholzibacteria bacterium]|nr:aminoacyl-histidine dipeptidase [Candidatus Krumholzibacteria bacterium]
MIDNLEPRHVWGHFDRIRQIPRPSKHEEKIREHLLAWARERGFETRTDKVGNTVVAVPASKGHEQAPILVLQAHMDMVCEKNADVKFDFSRDPIQLRTEGDWLHARGTTLGADNGVGMASAMAIVDDPDAVHGPLEILITVDEETGLTGAMQLDPSMVKGRRLLNLDTEELNAIYIGCSGGGNSEITIPVAREDASGNGVFLEVRITGLRGGHSGMDIVLQRGNAVQALARCIAKGSSGAKTRLASIEGGSAHNAIPREAFAVVAVQQALKDAFERAVRDEAAAIKEELGAADPEFTVEVRPATQTRVLDAESQRRVLAALLALPHGVAAMSLDVPGLVETSNNLAAVHTDDNAVRVLVSVRSSIRSALMALRARVQSVAELAGATVAHNDAYPGWKPNLKSEVLAATQRVHERALGQKAELKAVHAGLECGVIGEKLPGMDMVSIGPWIESPHSPSERVNIPSVATFWKFLKALVKELAS